MSEREHMKGTAHDALLTSRLQRALKTCEFECTRP
jgi:hypothetical protein